MLIEREMDGVLEEERLMLDENEFVGEGLVLIEPVIDTDGVVESDVDAVSEGEIDVVADAEIDGVVENEVDAVAENEFDVVAENEVDGVTVLVAEILCD